MIPICKKCGAWHEGNTHFCHRCGSALFAVTPPRPPWWESAAPGAPRSLSGACALPPPKRVPLAVLLAALFGPFGMFYSTLFGALAMLLICGFWFLIGCHDWLRNDLDTLWVTWPVCVLWAALAARIWNEQRR